MEKKFRYLVPGDYMADPAVHVFDGKLYIYPSHDRESGVEENDNGDHFDMCDYHVFSTEDVMNGTVTDHGIVLKVSDVPWAGRQLWDCDVACKNGNYYMYFPLKDRNDIFKLSDDMLQFAEEPRPLVILDEHGHPLSAGDNARRFFEASWMHKYNGKYYFSYSTGDTHLLCYATGDNPYGPFTYQGVILQPVVGWTTHHAIVEYKGKWYLFHHDCVPSGGTTWLRSLKVCELEYDAEGKIKTIESV